MRKISKALLDPHGYDPQDDRPRGVTGGTITSWNGPPDVDLDALFAKPSDQVSLPGAASAPVSADNQPAAKAPKGEPITFATTAQFITVTIL